MLRSIFMKRAMMIRMNLEAMDFNELWLLHEELTKILSEKITAEKLELEKRLAQLNPIEPIGEAARTASKSDKPRRKYPKVLPKYRNPSAPTQTWSGRGKQPLWLVAALRSGRNLEEFEISATEDDTGGKPTDLSPAISSKNG
jgi:DNA-binding protein H-NS